MIKDTAILYMTTTAVLNLFLKEMYELRYSKKMLMNTEILKFRYQSEVLSAEKTFCH